MFGLPLCKTRHAVWYCMQNTTTAIVSNRSSDVTRRYYRQWSFDRAPGGLLGTLGHLERTSAMGTTTLVVIIDLVLFGFSPGGDEGISVGYARVCRFEPICIDPAENPLAHVMYIVHNLRNPIRKPSTKNLTKFHVSRQGVS